MHNRVGLLVLLLLQTLHADFDYTVENTNFTISQGSVLPDEDKTYLYNYNRFRFRGDYMEDALFATVIADAVNYLGHGYVNSMTFDYVKQASADAPVKTQSSYYDYYEGTVYAKLYRLYMGYEDDKNRVIAGLQNISMGVGRIWTPTNLFNPKNTYALEPDETFGVMAFSYTRHLSDTSHMTVVASQKEDYSFKYAARYKAYLEFLDVAFNFISSDETKMIGYEFEGDAGSTGVELRSEGAWIQNRYRTGISTKEDTAFFQGIAGADYGFENGVTLVAEALYSSKAFSYDEVLLNLDSEILPNMLISKFYLGGSLNYAFNLFLEGSLVYIESFNTYNSRFIAPSLKYTLNDYHAFSLGAMIQSGSQKSEFGKYPNSYYFKYVFSF